MRNGQRVAVFVALVGGALFCLWCFRDRSAAPELMASAPARTAVDEPATTRAAPETEAASRTAASPTSAPALRTESRPLVLARVRGRCIAAETGEPLAGCSARFDGRPGNDGLMMRHGPVQWTSPPTVTTGLDGRFEIAFEPPPPYQHTLDVRADWRVPRTARWGAFRPGHDEDLGDIAMARGFPVAGRVVDTDGSPVEKVSVSLASLPLPVRGGMAANTERGGVSDANGRFQVDVPVPAGTWPLRLNARNVDLVRPEAVVVNEGTGAPDLTVVVRVMPYITGVVVDEQGAPVERVSLEAKVPGRHMASAWTRKDGSFQLYSTTTSPAPFRIASYGGRVWEPLEEPREFTWGTRDIRLVMRRRLTFEVQVLEDETGAPVEEFAVFCRRPNTSGADDLKVAGRFPGGKVTVPGTPRGKNLLFVQPKDLALWPNDPLEFELKDGGMAPLVARVRRMAPLVVTVVDRAAAPVTGTRVELLEPMGQPITLGSTAVEERDGGFYGVPPDQRHGRRLPPRLLARAETDASGTVTLHAFPGSSDLVLRAVGPGHLPALQESVSVPGSGARLTMTVGRGGAFAGRLTPPEVLRLQPRVLLRLTGQPGVQMPPDGNGVAVGPDGAVRIESLPPGIWDVLLKVRTGDGILLADMVLQPPLRSLSLVGDEQLTGELDASTFRPATVRGLVSVDGQSIAAGRVEFAAVAGTNGNTAWRAGPFPVDESGRFRAENLLPGTYRLQLQPAETGSRTIPARNRFVLQPGAELEQTFRLRRQQLRLRLLQADGKTPIAATQCMVTGAGYAMPLTTDPDGWLVLDPAPPEAVHVQTTIQGGAVRLGPAQMPEEPAQAEVVLTAPAR